MSNLKNKIEIMKNSILKTGIATGIAASALAPTLKAQAQEHNSQQITQNAQKTTDNGLPRNIAARDVASMKTHRLYDWNDVVKKYGLNAQDYAPNAKVTKEKAAMLSAIVEYEASRPEAVMETNFYRDLSGEHPMSENEMATYEQNAKDNADNVKFEDIYQKKLAEMENKQDRKAAMNNLESFINSSTKHIDFTKKVDNKVVENQNGNNKAKTLSFVQAYKMSHNNFNS